MAGYSELQERELGVVTEYPILSEGYPLTNSNRRSSREIIRPVTEPPEMVTVEMTSEEQDVYALMGISPVLVLEEGKVRNPKSAIISVKEPGEADVKKSIENREEIEVETVTDYEDENEELDELDASVAEAPNSFDSEEENGQYEVEISDSDVEQDLENGDSDDSTPIRRRRRRSSAITEE